MLVNDLSVKLSNYRKNIDFAVKRVLNRSWFVLGPEVNAFEEAFANYLKVNSCLTVANGTDALEIGLRAVNVKPGDEVATVANAGFYTSTAILGIGAVPVYLDVDLKTKLITINEVKRAISLGVKAIVVTHLYGQASKEIFEIAEICRSNSIALIEDCAQAHGAKINGKFIGSFGDIGCFSFYPTKNLGALGDGGAIVTNQAEIAEKIAAYRQYGWNTKYNVESLGKNSRLDEIQASILVEFLPFLDKWNERRRNIARKYSEGIQHSEVFNPIIGGDDYVAHLYVITTFYRKSLQNHLKSNGISSDIHYPIPDTRQKIFGDRYANVSLPNTEKLSNEVLSLPCYPEMSDDDVQTVINVINNWKL